MPHRQLPPTEKGGPRRCADVCTFAGPRNEIKKGFVPLLHLAASGSMYRSTDASNSWVCLFSLNGVAVAIPARCLIFDDLMGCTVLEGGADRGFLAMGILRWVDEPSEYTFCDRNRQASRIAS
jgi:hypothetical protein